MRGRALAVVVVSVMCLTSLEITDAWARARGGGSRGSRSYTAPARPAASPSAPSRPSEPSPASAPARAPGATPTASPGGFGGILPGLLAGGFIGSLFLRGGGGGLGMLDLLLLGGAVFLVVRRGRGPRPAFGSFGATASASGPIVGAPVAAPLDEAAIVAASKQLFSSLQSALAMRDVSLLCDRMSPRMYGGLRARCDELRAARQHSRIGRVEFQRVEVAGIWGDRDQEWTRVCLQGSMVEAIVDDVTATVVDGSETEPRPFEEYWTFQRLLGSTRWKLCGIQAVETAAAAVAVS